MESLILNSIRNRQTSIKSSSDPGKGNGQTMTHIQYIAEMWQDTLEVREVQTWTAHFVLWLCVGNDITAFYVVIRARANYSTINTQKFQKYPKGLLMDMSNILDREKETSEETGQQRVTHYKRNVSYLPKGIRDTTAMIGLSPNQPSFSWSLAHQKHIAVCFFLSYYAFFGFGRTDNEFGICRSKTKGQLLKCISNSADDLK